MYFDRKFSKIRADHSYHEGMCVEQCMVLSEFPAKIDVKIKKKLNFQNSFDNSIDNHVFMPETQRRVVWSDLDPL